MDRYALYAANMPGTSPLFVSQLRSKAISSGIAEALEGFNGSVDPTANAIGTQRPAFSLETTKVKTLLTTIGIDGLKFVAAGTYTSFDAYFQQMTAGGLRATGSTAIKMTAAKGLILPRRLSVSQGAQNAVLSLDVIVSQVLGSGTAPIVCTASQALPAGSPGTAEAFALGPVMINGTQLDGILGWDLDFGLAEILEWGDGVAFPTHVCIGSRQPVLTARTREASFLTTIGISGTTITADAVFYLRAREEGGTVYADDETEHVSLTVKAGRVEVTQGTAGVPGELAVRVRPISNETDPIVEIGTGVAIV